MKFPALLTLAAFATQVPPCPPLCPDDVIARGLKVSSVATDQDGIRTVELNNPQARYTLQCPAVIDSCSMPAVGSEFTLEKSRKRLYVGDNVRLTQNDKDAGHFRLVRITAR